MAGIDATRSLFFAGVFHYGSIAQAAKAFGIPRTTYSDILRPGKTGGKTKPTVVISEKTKEKVNESLFQKGMSDDRKRLIKTAEFFEQKLTPNQLRALRNERGEDSFYKRENLDAAIESFKKKPTKGQKKRNLPTIRALREIGY